MLVRTAEESFEKNLLDLEAGFDPAAADTLEARGYREVVVENLQRLIVFLQSSTWPGTAFSIGARQAEYCTSRIRVSGPRPFFPNIRRSLQHGQHPPRRRLLRILRTCGLNTPAASQ